MRDLSLTNHIIGLAGLYKQPEQRRSLPETATSVVAIAGRYPGSAPDGGIKGFWQALQSEKDLPSTVPLQRWDIEEYFSPEGKGKQLSMYVRHAAFIEDLDSFDASLFRYGPSY